MGNKTSVIVLSPGNEERPLVSVLMNCYNGARYLREAIESILSQTYQNWEVIFWDNQSTDNSAEIFLHYKDPRLHYFMAPKHTILGDARKDAINYIKGEWVGILDCDDIWCQTKLQDQINIINKESHKINQLGLVYGRVLGINQNGQQKNEIGHEDYLNRPMPEGEIFEELLFKGNFIMGPSILFNFDAFKSIGGFPQGYVNASDFYISCAIASKYDVKAVNRYVAKYRIHENNLTLAQKTVSYEEQLKVFDCWSKFSKASDAKKKHRVKQINVYAGLMTIKYDKQFFAGFGRIIFRGSLFFAMKYISKHIFKLRIKPKTKEVIN